MSEDIKTTKRAAMTWTDFSSRRWDQIDRPTSNLGKIALERFTSEQSIPHLRLIKIFKDSSEVRFENLPAYFAFKPASLWSGTGVRLLHQINGLEAYYDAMAKVVVNPDEVVEQASRLEAKLGRKLQFLVEERAIDEDIQNAIPLDYKVFTFLGVTKFVLQVNRNYNPTRMAFFDGEFSPIDDERVQINPARPETRGEHRRPKCWRGILDIARQLTLLMDAPFISVDCYATKNGPVLGELTHTPGGPWYGSMYSFSPDFELELGLAWRNANARLGLPETEVRVPYQISRNGKVMRTID